MLSFKFASTETAPPAVPPAIPFDTLVAAAETVQKNTIVNQYKQVVENIEDDDAKEFVQALVFLATRPHESPSVAVACASEFPPIPSASLAKTKRRDYSVLLKSLLKSSLRRHTSSPSLATMS